MAADHKPLFAFIALSDATLPSLEQFEAAMVDSLPPGTALAELQITERKNITLLVNGESVIIGLMEMPIPWGDLEGPCACSWLWNTAAEEMKRQAAHLIVMFNGASGTQVERAIVLTKLLAGVTRCFRAIGPYWGHGCVVLPVPLLRELADEATVERPPLLAWIEFRLQRQPNGTLNILTTGLRYFDCMEIEVIGSSLPFPEIVDNVSGVATTLLWGEKYADGDTFGPDRDNRYKTWHAPSIWPRSEPVLRLEI